MDEKVLHEVRVIETEDGFRIEMKGDKERLRELIFSRGMFGMGQNGHGPFGHHHGGHGDRHGFGPFGRHFGDAPWQAWAEEKFKRDDQPVNKA